MAAPSRRNSGLDTTEKSASGRTSRMMRSTSSPVPIGTVDLDDDRVAVELARDLARRLVDVGQIGVTVTAPRRRADRNEDGIGRAHRGRRVGLEKQTRLLRILRDQIVEAGFENRDHAVSQRANLAGVLRRM